MTTRKSYEDHEICLIWQVARSPENKATLAKLLDRTEGAIDMIWRHCEEPEGIGPRSSKVLTSQVHLWGVKRLGRKKRGVIKTLRL